MHMNDRLYTREEVAEIFRVNPRTVDRWIRVGELKRVDAPGNIVRIPASEVERRLLAVEPKQEGAGA
jgi:excisionase family DNA binding protein